MLQPGDPAPNFRLRDQHGDDVSLADFAGRTVVLFFYPKPDTPGCTVQACGVRDRSEDYTRADAVVLGVSPDPVSDIAAFDDKYGLGFPLLSDPDHSVADTYGVWVEKSKNGRRYWGNERSTFVIGPDGRIVDVLRRVEAARHDELVLGVLGQATA